MSTSIQSLNSSPWPTVARGLTPKQQLRSFEVNAKEFGPVAASLIGVAQAAGDGAENLATAGQQAVQTFESALSSAASTVEKAAASAVATVKDALSTTAATVGDLASGVAGYATLGVAAGAVLMHEVA